MERQSHPEAQLRIPALAPSAAEVRSGPTLSEIDLPRSAQVADRPFLKEGDNSTIPSLQGRMSPPAIGEVTRAGILRIGSRLRREEGEPEAHGSCVPSLETGNEGPSLASRVLG